MAKSMVLAEFLKNRRIQKGLTQSAVAEKLGYTTSQFISNWERGISSPPMKTLKKLSKMYGVSPEEVYEIVLEVSVQEVTSKLQRNFFSVDQQKKKSS